MSKPESKLFGTMGLPCLRIPLAIGILAASFSYIFATPAESQPKTTLAPCATGQFVPQRYIVVLQKSAYQSGLRHAPSFSTELFALHQLEVKFGVTTIDTFEHALPGAALIAATDQQALRLAADPAVKYIEPDKIVVAADDVAEPWDLVRISQRRPDLNSRVGINPNIYSGENVHVFVLDSGIRATHKEFNPHQVDSYPNPSINCDGSGSGHGTAVASVIAGQTVGVARNARLHSVQVLDCYESGDSHTVMDGINYVEKLRSLGPTLVNLSLEVCDGDSQALDDAVREGINSYGLTFVIASGNDGQNASNHSPSKVEDAIVVGASTEGDQVWSMSNYGSGISLFAPGTGVTTAGNSNDAAYAMPNGTSFAAPIVTGIAALYLQKCPQAKPSDVKRALISSATVDVLVPSTLQNSPNRLAYMGELPACPHETPLHPEGGENYHTGRGA